MSPHSIQHKVISVVISTVAVYFGFQTLDLISGIYQMHIFFIVAWVVFAFHIFWLTFMFDLHLKSSGHLTHAKQNFSGVSALWQAFKSRVRHLYHWHYLRHYLNYLILPVIIYWSVVILIYLNPFFELFKDGLIVVNTIVLAMIYWHMKEVFSHNMEVHKTGLKILFLGKLFAAYLMYTALIAVGWYFGLSLSALLPATFILTFLLIYQALLQSKLLELHIYPAIIMMSTLITLCWVLVFQNWNVNYYTAGLMIIVIYNTCWGIMHRFLDRTLTWKITWEYIFMLIVLVSFILGTHDFHGRI